MKTAFWGTIALLTCPCHIVIIALLFAGSSIGAVISNNFVWVFLGLAVVFGFSLFMATRGPLNTSTRTSTGKGAEAKTTEIVHDR